LTVTVAGRTKTVDERTVRGWLRADDATSSYAVNATTAKAALAALFPDVGGPGSDATVAIVFGNPVITGGDPATSCCADDTGDRVLAALKAGKHDVELALAATPHARGKEWAQGLGIREVVGQFTTRYPAGQPRVKNIKRIAELMQNVVIEPGQTFSINEFIGKRTTDKGFVSAGVIQNGVFQEDVGGGISQFATTTFNAAFFAGLDFAEYQSHSIYINRYPYGREATLSYPSPDLKIVNSTPYGILVATNATDTSITVQLWSTKFAHGEQTAQSERQVGKSCTRVTTERTRTYVDGRPNKVDTVTAVYRPEGVDCNGNPSAPSVTAVPPTTAPPPPGPTPTTTPPPTTAPAPGPSPTTVPPATSTPPAGPPPTTAAPAGLVGASRR
jgi:vancomycin resistance protein YoaR